MGVNIELARKAEKLARQKCREIGQPEALWQMMLSETYAELCPTPDDAAGQQAPVQEEMKL